MAKQIAGQGHVRTCLLVQTALPDRVRPESSLRPLCRPGHLAATTGVVNEHSGKHVTKTLTQQTRIAGNDDLNAVRTTTFLGGWITFKRAYRSIVFDLERFGVVDDGHAKRPVSQKLQRLSLSTIEFRGD